MTKDKGPHLSWEEKYEALTAAAQEIIDRETSERDKKTEHLRELRRAQDAKMADESQTDGNSAGPVPKARRIRRARTQR